MTKNKPVGDGASVGAGRTLEAVAQKASEERISLKPTNQSPYNRRKV